MQYRIAHRYTSWRDGNRYGPWAAGALVELDPAVADWINTDSPGTCVLDGPAPEPTSEVLAVTEPDVKAVTEPEAKPENETTFQSDADTTGDAEKPEADSGEAAESGTKPAAKPKKAGQNRAHTPARTRK